MAYHMGTMTVRGWIEEAAVIGALIEGCDRNNYLREHGCNATVKTIKSGINAGCNEPHLDLPDRDPSHATPTADGNVTPLHDSTSIEPTADLLANFVFMGDDKPSPQKMLIDGVMPLEVPFLHWGPIERWQDVCCCPACFLRGNWEAILWPRGKGTCWQCHYRG